MWLAILAPVATAQPAPAPAPAPEPVTDNRETVIKGEYLKPEITVIISRENLNKVYELVLDESFLDKISESVRHEPF